MAKTDSLAVAKLSSSVAASRSSSSIGWPRVVVGSLQQVLKKKNEIWPGVKNSEVAKRRFHLHLSLGAFLLRQLQDPFPIFHPARC